MPGVWERDQLDDTVQSGICKAKATLRIEEVSQNSRPFCWESGRPARMRARGPRSQVRSIN